MPELLDPTRALRESFVAAVAEFRDDRDYVPTWFVTDTEPAALTDAAAFDLYLARKLAEREPSTERPDWFVPMTTMWWVDGEQVLGAVNIRHALTPALERVGGHIGYDVRPSARRRGHATAMLRAALPVARGLGIERALLTCDITNLASQRVIEANGGQRIDTVGAKFRYWVPTG